MPPRLLELCPADWLNLLEAFPLQDKVALAYLCLTIAEVKSGIWRAVTLDGLPLLMREHLILTDRMGL